MRLRFARGFTLIEVLVALCVLAIGALGAAAMQLAAMRARHQSSLASDAVQLAGSLADSMRANRAAMGAGANPYLIRYDAAADGAPLASGPPCHAGAPCDALQLAAAEVHQFKQSLHAHYPGGRVVVCRDGAAELTWACDEAAAAPVMIKIGWRGAGTERPRVAVALPGAGG
jgi:type IV pilus assembly protein PilV